MARDILEIYSNGGHELVKKTPAEYAGPCPACGGKDRFLLFPGQGRDGLGRYLCRQCERTGDAIQFLRDFHGLTYGQACREVGREPARPEGNGQNAPRAQAPTSTPEHRPSRTGEPRENPTPSGRWQDKTTTLVIWAEQRLAENAEALEWLESERGLSPETIKQARLGWVPEDMWRDRRAWGLPQELKSNGKPRRMWIPQGLLVPVLDPAGGVKRIKFRRPKPGPKEPRYLPLPTDPKNTAPLLVRTGARAWAVVESELDALLLAQEAGDLVNVAALGSASYKPDKELDGLLGASAFVLVCLDYDEAGSKAAWSWWKERFSFDRVRVWPVPEGKDPCDAWKQGWDLRAWIEGGLPPALAPASPESPEPAPRAATMPGPKAEAMELAVVRADDGKICLGMDLGREGWLLDLPPLAEGPQEAFSLETAYLAVLEFLEWAGGDLFRFRDGRLGVAIPINVGKESAKYGASLLKECEALVRKHATQRS